MIGKSILHYRIIEKLGQGGMGVVYLADDTKLERQVAIKFLPNHIASNSDERKRLEIEAKAAAALNHPNIATIHAIEEADNQLFLVMEYIEGKELKDVAGTHRDVPLPTETTIDYAIQIAKGLQAAHEKGIVHRDIKSTNIMVTDKGDIKIMDFGLAKFRGSAQLTQIGTTVGTAAYMSPEQARGEEANQQADIWSFGVVLYELLTGALPFKGDYDQAVIYAILNEEAKLDSFNSDVPDKLKAIVKRTLKKNPDERYQNISEVLNDLNQLLGSSRSIDIQQSAGISFGKLIKKPFVFFPTLTVLILIALFVYKYIEYQHKLVWARNVALPKIEQLIRDKAWTGEGPETWQAFKLSNKVKEYLADDPAFINMQHRYSVYTRFFTEPAGADIYVKPYANPDSAWYHLGQTPVDSVRLPQSIIRLRIEKKGYETLEDVLWIFNVPEYSYNLSVSGDIPADMVKVQGSERLGEFLIDKYEVTNSQYKTFMESGGYKDKKYWKYDIIKDGNIIPWEKAMGLFKDKTDVSGPATWEVGDYPKKQDNYPVAGISWYEAAAYAEFRGKDLPTVEHWHYVATGNRQQSEIIPIGNYKGNGTFAVGSSNSMNRFGAYDMAGNVREWCWNNRSDTDRKYILGGGWDDPDYTFGMDIAQDPLNRSAVNGVRCIKYIQTSIKTDDLFNPRNREWRDYTKERPVSDEKFEEYKRAYIYAKTPLNSKIETTDESNDDWIKQTVKIDAAYNDEKITIFCFLPKTSRPPFQAVVYFPGAAATRQISSKNLTDTREFEWLPKSGRALIYPVYKGTYERYVSADIREYPVLVKDMTIKWVQDYQRVLDYLETRDDMDKNKFSYYGFSLGGAVAPVVLAIENRIKTGILYVAGLGNRKPLPEVDAFNFAPRVTVPVLMLNGKYDDFVPYEESQKPLYDFLGTAKVNKKWVVYENGHSVPRQELIKEILNWLDKYLGPVK